VVRKFVAALNAGDRQAFFAVSGDQIVRFETGHA
jgi:hypothetical protein